MNEMNILVVDSGSSHTILRDKRYFTNLIMQDANISTIAGISRLIEGHGHAFLSMPNGT